MGVVNAAEPELVELFATAGGPAFTPALRGYLRRGAPAHDGILRAYAEPGRYGISTRAAFDDLGSALSAVGRRWPDRFVRHVRANPALGRDIVVLRVVGGIDRAAARDLLVEVAQGSDLAHVRQAALAGLISTGDPRLSDLLTRLIGDPQQRDLALLSALDFGDQRLLPKLRRMAAAATTEPGHREQAYDAIAAIGVRSGLPPAPAHPGWRPLVEVPRPAPTATVIHVDTYRFQFVRAGTRLARLLVGTTSVTVLAPCDGLVETIGARRGTAPLPVLFRLRPIPWDPAEFVGLLRATAGDHRFWVLVRQLPEFGEAACDAIFAHYGQTSDAGIARHGGHPLDIHDSLTSLLTQAARRWPDRFLHHLRDHPDAGEDLTLLWALAEVDRPAARDLLVEAARHRAAGHDFHRTYGLRGLARLADPRLPDLLLDLISDRSSSVRFAATKAALEAGDTRLLPALQRLSEDPGHPGAQEYARDAIELIRLRAGLVEVPPEQRRLLEVVAPASDRSRVVVTQVGPYAYEYELVREGQELAQVRVGRRRHRVVAPVSGEIVTANAQPGRPAPPVLFRIRPRRATRSSGSRADNGINMIRPS